jgi:tRNA pseudouridine55 synthase
VDGVLLVDKPAGPTSHDVVERVRRALGERRVGHTGTLDPFATGLLALCVGRATRLARFLSAGDKVYLASVRLGFATTTDDLTGEPLSPASPARPARAALEAALASLVGTFDQLPPAFSARHVGGRRSHELARRGETVARTATPVTVHSLRLLSHEDEVVRLEVRCSPGTYVRALARDLGERLGTGGHLVALRRTRSGPFDLGRALAGDDLARAAESLVPMRELLPDLPAAQVGPAGRALVAHGRDLGAQDVLDGFPAAGADTVRLVDAEGELLAVAVRRVFEPRTPGLPRVEALHPEVVLVETAGVRS